LMLNIGHVLYKLTDDRFTEFPRVFVINIPSWACYLTKSILYLYCFTRLRFS